MFMDLIATLTAGAGLAGVVMVIRAVLKGRLPKYIIPAAIGLGMLLFSVWNEYSWFPRVRDAMPEGVKLVSTPEDRVFYRPWTYVFPVITRFAALDMTAKKVSAVNPAIRMVDVLLVQRWVATTRIPLAFDCANSQRVDLVGGVSVAPDGTVSGGKWQAVDAADEMQQTACMEG